MKKLIFVLMSFVAISLQAQLISVDALSKSIKDPKMVVIDARAAGDYLKTHIDGAINIPITTLYTNSPVEGSLKSVKELAALFGSHGVSQNSKIVIYCKSGINAGYMYWVLDYLGAKDVSILDGQMDAWFAGRKPITKNAKKLPATTFTPSVKSSILVNKAQVNSKLNSAVLIDSRKKEDYAAGKIGNAINIPSESLLAKSKLKPTAALQAMFKDVPKNKEVIIYCKTGVNAGLVYFVMKSVLNYPNVKVYEDAYVDWVKK